MLIWRRVLPALCSVLLLVGCQAQTVTTPTPAPGEEAPVDLPPMLVELELELPPAPVRARMLAVGDLLMHLPLVQTSALPDGSFDFTPIFEQVRPWIEAADVAYANLETTLAGDQWPWAGYPSFNTPPAFARDLKRLGFDVVTHANNHTLDYGEIGLNNTVQALEEAGLVRTGGFRTEEEREQIATYTTANGVTIAFFAYTYGTNGIPLPYPHSVNLLDPDRIVSDVRRARATEGIDLVAVALHFGDEYAREPNEQQEELVELTLAAGADIILGSHPHVLQRAEIRQVVDEHGRDLPRAVIFSMGNFLSNQVGMHRLQGVMFLVDMIKGEEGARVEALHFIPTYAHPYWADGALRYRISILEQAIGDFERGADPWLTEALYEEMQVAYPDALAHLPGTEDVSQWRASWPVGAQPIPERAVIPASR